MVLTKMAMKIHHYKRFANNTYYFVAAFPAPDINLTYEIRKWCYEAYGLPNYKPDTVETRWEDDVKYGEITFERESDLTLFLLRWQ